MNRIEWCLLLGKIVTYSSPVPEMGVQAKVKATH